MLSLKRRNSRVEILLETRGVLAVDLIGIIIKTFYNWFNCRFYRSRAVALELEASLSSSR